MIKQVSCDPDRLYCPRCQQSLVRYHDENLCARCYAEVEQKAIGRFCRAIGKMLLTADQKKEIRQMAENYDMGEDAVLLCWEGPEMFCHRHLVADWLMNALKIEVTELRRLGNGQETMF